MAFLGRETRREPLGGRTSGGVQAGQRRLRLLAVDEDATALSVIGRRLSHLGHDVVLAENGFVALGLMEAQHFDLILIDLMMAKLPGVETLRKMRVSGLMGDASVMLVAGRDHVHEAAAALAEGADDYIVKPFDFDILDARVRHIVARAAQVRELVRYNDVLDARIARRAVELGETRAELEEMHADRARLVASIQSLHDELQRLSALRDAP